jgi:hypothetical protein
MKKLLALLSFVLPISASATVWQINAVGTCDPHQHNCAEGVKVTGQFTENEGVLGAWHFTAQFPGWAEGAASDDPCWHLDPNTGEPLCRRAGTLSSRNLALVPSDIGSPTYSASLNLPLAADLGSANVIDLVPGRCDFDELFQECVFGGSVYHSFGGQGALNELLSGTIMAVPEPSITTLLSAGLMLIWAFLIRVPFRSRPRGGWCAHRVL